jgi:hypothetical protein
MSARWRSGGHRASPRSRWTDRRPSTPCKPATRSRRPTSRCGALRASPRQAGPVESRPSSSPRKPRRPWSESTARSREPIADSRVTGTSTSAARSPTSIAAGTTSHSSSRGARQPRAPDRPARAGRGPRKRAHPRIDLNALVGKPFTIGEVQCLGQRLCEPCAHLKRLTASAGKPGTLRALIHKGGLRADVLNDGELRVGDAITAR